MDRSTGKLIIAKALDYELTGTYSLVVRASDRSAIPMFATSTIQLAVLDANDNLPTCSASLYTASVHENATFMTAVVAVDCSDIDTVGVLKYSIVEGNFDSVFIVNENSGEISVAQENTLDAETIGIYDLIIGVSDGKYTINVTTVISILDDNDLPPYFVPPGPYHIDISEDTSVGYTLAEFLVSDDDVSATSLTFSIATGNAEGKFTISQSNGILQLLRTIDREAIQDDAVYTLEIIVTDNVFTATTTVVIDVIDVNDNYPVCDQTTYTTVIPETTTPGSTVFTPLCNDPDLDTDMLFQIIEGHEEDTFIIDLDDGKLKVKSHLDYEKTTSYTITVTVSDQGTPALTNTLVMTIFVGAINENPPIFYGDFNVSIAEGAHINQAIITIFANDSDKGLDHASVTYAIKNGNTDDLFSIHPSTGVILLRGRLDYETTKTHILTVTATDMTPAAQERRSSEETLVIHVSDINDNYPTFNPQIYSVEINENMEVGKTILEVFATDADAGQAGTSGLEFSIVDGDIGSFFSVLGNAIILADLLDADTKANYILTVSAADQGSPSLSSNAIIAIHVKAVNDHSPSFSLLNDTIAVEETVKIGSNVYQCSATDEDTGIYSELRYYIRNGNTNDAFAVDTHSGEISVAKSLDYEAIDSPYILILEVEDTQQTDPGITRTGTMTLTVYILDVNDDTPAFSKNTYTASINENVAIGTYIVTVTAVDKDSGPNGLISYQITSGNGISHFNINSSSGVITTGSVIDYETTISYNLIVTAEDSGEPKKRSSCLVKVTVIDLNDETPEFEVKEFVTSVIEQEPPNTFVTSVIAVDADSEANNNNIFTYSFAQSSAHFMIDHASGNVTTVDILDRETTQR